MAIDTTVAIVTSNDREDKSKIKPAQRRKLLLPC